MDDRAPTAVVAKDWPAIPVLISQGHEWHMLMVTKTSTRLTIRVQITIGSKECVRCAESFGRAALAAELGGDGLAPVVLELIAWEEE
jgi:uncharacterized protein (UPF0212 family)